MGCIRARTASGGAERGEEGSSSHGSSTVRERASRRVKLRYVTSARRGRDSSETCVSREPSELLTPRVAVAALLSGNKKKVADESSSGFD